MSLWEELSDIGEEFVEFLEKEIGLGPPEVSRSGPIPACMHELLRPFEPSAGPCKA